MGSMGKGGRSTLLGTGSSGAGSLRVGLSTWGGRGVTGCAGLGGRLLLAVRGCPGPCRVLSSTPGHEMPGRPPSSDDNPKSLQTLPTAPWGPKCPHPWLRTAAVESGIKALAKGTSSLQEKPHKAHEGPTVSRRTHAYLRQLLRFRPRKCRVGGPSCKR